MSKQNNPDIILISNVDSTFVRHDEDLLSSFGKVDKLICYQPKGLLGFLREQLRILRFIASRVKKTDAVFCWFADYHSFWPALLTKWAGKPFYLIQGGYDTTRIQRLSYGVFTNFVRTAMVNYAYRNARLNLPVSEFLAKEIFARYGDKVKVEVLPTGYDLPEITKQTKEALVLTVAAADTQKRLLIKGVDRFIHLAQNAPNISFMLVGMKREHLNNFDIPNNLKVQEFLATNELGLLYQKTKVYAQFSVREGLPNAVLEAMSYECVVVGMNHSGIAEAVGDCGYLIDKWDVDEARVMLEKALDNNSLGSLARIRVQENFKSEKRLARLRQFVNPAGNN